MAEIGYLMHGQGTNGPFCTEQVPVKPDTWPNAGLWLCRFEGRWRRVHQSISRTWIVYQGQRITIKIEGV